ncbi:Hypothetical protein D9617_6g093300 [Elsinoe fawcettii]|nr:Hypothetical protein D9617_6g093300 [Elsinoe fawcettii]
MAYIYSKVVGVIHRKMDDDPYDEGLYEPAASTPQPLVSDKHDSSDNEDYLQDLEREGTAEAFTETASAGKRPLDTDGEVASPKRQKVDTSPSNPSPPKVKPELIVTPEPFLQHVFSYLNPVDIRACHDTCQTFRKCITTTQANINDDKSVLPAMSGDDIWQASWELHANDFPAILDGVSAKRMIELLSSDRCESCGTQPTTLPERKSFWNTGPGQNGTRVIWQFQARMCGNCFEQETIMDVELIVSPDKVLMPLLPFVFRTADKNYISPSQVTKGNKSIPSSLIITKVYHRKSLGKVRDTYDMFKKDFPEALDGYKKDAAAATKRKIDDAGRWAAWEASLPPGVSSALAAKTMFILADNLPTHTDNMTRNQYGQQGMSGDSFIGTLSSNPSNASTPQPAQASQTSNSSLSDYRRTRVLAARKDDLERLCWDEFQPPIAANVLQYIPAFLKHCAYPIPVTSPEWMVLKPIIGEQRLQAEQTQQRRMNSVNPSEYVDQITQRVSRQRGAIAQDPTGNNYEERAQKAVRVKLLSIGHSVVEERWDSCKRLLNADFENFAADALLTSLDRFREETNTKDYQMGHSITLETMKYLFDNLVKPVLEGKVAKAFICAECDDVSAKYTFDGMMQHFGAKHDSDFGNGNVVVSWHTALWPDDPPFKRHPFENRRVPPMYAITAREQSRPAAPLAQIQTAPTVPLAITPDIDALLRSLRTPDGATANFNLQSFTQNAQTSANLCTDFAPGSSNYQAGHTTPVAQVKQEVNREVKPEFNSEFKPKREPSAEPKPNSQVMRNNRSRVQRFRPYPEHQSDNPYLRKYKAPPKVIKPEEKEEVGKAAKFAHRATGAVPDLDDALRLKAIIIHIAEVFIKRFDRPLDVTTFAGALSSRPDMKPLRKFTGLYCHLCVEEADGDGMVPVEQLDPSGAGRAWGLGALLQHYKQSHVDDDDQTPAAWLENMIELPHVEAIKEIVNLTGMTQEKLELLIAAVPGEIFPDGIPQLEVPASAVATPSADPANPVDLSALTSFLINPFQNPPPAHASPYASPANQNGKRKRGGLVPYDNEEAEVSLTEAGEDEYDPRRPILPSGPSPPLPGEQLPTSFKGRTKTKPKGRKGHSQPKKKKRYDDDDYNAPIPDVIRSEYIPGQHDKEEGQISDDEEEESSEEEESPAPSPMLGRRGQPPKSRKRNGSRRQTPEYGRNQQSSGRNASGNKYGGQASNSRPAQDTGPRLPTSYEEYKRQQAAAVPAQASSYSAATSYVPPPSAVQGYGGRDSMPPRPTTSQRYDNTPVQQPQYGQVLPLPQYQQYGQPAQPPQYVQQPPYAQPQHGYARPPSPYNRAGSPYALPPAPAYAQQPFQPVHAQPAHPQVYGQGYDYSPPSPYAASARPVQQPQQGQYGQPPQGYGQGQGRNYYGGYDSGGY